MLMFERPIILVNGFAQIQTEVTDVKFANSLPILIYVSSNQNFHGLKHVGKTLLSTLIARLRVSAESEELPQTDPKPASGKRDESPVNVEQENPSVSKKSKPDLDEPAATEPERKKQNTQEEAGSKFNVGL